LGVLTAAHLLTEPTPGRYALHDLLRAYGAELSHAEDSDVERSAAVDRMLDHYLHTANGVTALVYPSRPPIALAVPAPGAIVEPLTDRQQGLTWLAAEHQVLVAGVELAARAGQDLRAWALASSISEYLYRQGLWTAVDVRTQEIACEAARRLGDPAALAYSQRRLGAAWIRLGRADKAIEHMREALAASALGDTRERGAAHLDLAFAYSQCRRYADALRESQSALDLFRVAGRRRGEALALNAIGWYHTQLGNHEQAIVRCEEAIAIMREIDDLRALGQSYDSLGYAHHQLGDHERAIACFQKAIGLFDDFSDRSSQADSLIRLGDVQRATGDHAGARATYEQALTILDGMGHPGATLVRERLGDES
jgi:tetratricopeptide (TPR) repeat protein